MNSVDLSKRGIIVVLCRHLGGYGGEENYVMCMVDALRDFETVVFVTKSLKEFGLVPRSRPNLVIQKYRPVRFARFLVRHAQDIALLFAFSADRFKGDWFVYRLLDQYRFAKALNPAGNPVEHVAAHFDYLVWEADNASAFGCAGDPKNRVLRPPALHPTNMPASFPSFSTSEDYYLTVFNNYNGTLKGFDLMLAAATESRRRIIWCTSDSRLPADLPRNVVPVCASRELISMLMKSCRAYVCFSASEGFGWSIFEAMIHGRPIISRHIGVACDFKDQVCQFTSLESLIHLLNVSDLPEQIRYDLSAFSPALFVEAISAMIAVHSC